MAAAAAKVGTIPSAQKPSANLPFINRQPNHHASSHLIPDPCYDSPSPTHRSPSGHFTNRREAKWKIGSGSNARST